MPPRIPRRFQRYKVHWEVQTVNGQPATETFLLDLSAVGAKLEAPQPLAPRMHLEFTFLLPGAETKQYLSGSIVWSRPLVQAPGRFQMGVKFYEANWQLDLELRNAMTVPAEP